MIDDNKIQISGGNVTGISKGDKIGLYNIGTSTIDDETSVISGVVSKTNNFNATVEFSTGHNVTNLKSYWVFIEEYNLENSYMGIYIEDIDNDLNEILLPKLEDINNLTNLHGRSDRQADLL